MPVTPTEGGEAIDEDRTDLRVSTEPPQRDSEEFTVRTLDPPLPVPVRDDAELAPGTTLNEYEVESKIGEGGMGTVFSARHPVIGKRAAIKVLRKDLCDDPTTLERFIDEARIVNQVGHPNIVDVFAFGRLEDGRNYLVMEWLKGESLRDRVQRGKLDLFESCAILRALSRALEAAHDKGVVHRDLKPDNVFLVEERDEMPRVKLLDFGIAKLVRDDQHVARTATGAMVGTPQYVAPEQAKGHTIDARVDIYSLGCVAFELLTGRPPFVADNAMEMVAKHLMERPPRPSSIEKSIPRQLDAIIFEMLSKDRDDRPSLTEIAAVLDRMLKHPMATTSTTNTGMSYAITRLHAVPQSSAKWIAVGAAGAVAMAVLAFVAVKALAASDDPKPASTFVPAAAAPPAPAAVPAPDKPAQVPEHAEIVTVPAPSPPAQTEPPVAPKSPTRPVHKPPPVVTKPKRTVKPEAKPAQPEVKPAPKAMGDHDLLEPGTLAPK